MPLVFSLIIGAPFLVGGLVLLVAPRSARGAGLLALLAPAAVSGLGFVLWRQVADGPPLLVSVEWLPALGINLSLAADRLSAFFVLLVGLIGIGIVQYARHYLGPRASGGWWALLLGFMGSMLGIVLCDSVLLLFVFWELTTIFSSLLIGWSFDEGKARHGAIQAFLVTSGGALFMLAGLVLMAGLAGSFELSAWSARAERLAADPRHALPLVLILVGAFTKSAQFPFHFWLPGAMAAETPVSAYLHSATMVKAGIYLALRLFPLFAASPLWAPLLAGVGMATFVIAGWSALRSHDLKEVLAYSTSAYLGLLIASLGYAAGGELEGELLNITNHAVYKSSLFLLVGWIEKRTGTRDLRTLEPERWLLRFPFAAALVAVGIFAMAGMPLLLGFVSKELFFETVSQAATSSLSPGMVLAVVGSALAFAYSLKVFIDIFFGDEQPPTDRGQPRHEVSGWLLAVPALLLVVQLAGGVAPWAIGRALEPEHDWALWPALWHEAGALLAMSLDTFAAGGVLFVFRRRIYRVARLPGAGHLFDGLAHATLRGAGRLGDALQAGGHPRYLAVVLFFAVGAMAAALFWNGGLPAVGEAGWGPEAQLGWLPLVFVGGSAIGAVALRGRIPKAVMIAISGYGVAVYYVVYRAPDVALTQVLVETISLVLLVLIFGGMPPLTKDRRGRGQKAWHLAVSGLGGAAMAVFAWSAGLHEAPGRAGEEQLALGLPQAGGKNVVNDILVDFRGGDTLGEITVLAIAALGVIALVTAGLYRGREAVH